MKCKCGNFLFTIDIIPCCDDCSENGAWDSDTSEYVYDEGVINNFDLERDEVQNDGECRFDTAFGAGCYMFTCNNCNKKTNLPVMNGC